MWGGNEKLKDIFSKYNFSNDMTSDKKYKSLASIYYR